MRDGIIGARQQLRRKPKKNQAVSGLEKEPFKGFLSLLLK